MNDGVRRPDQGESPLPAPPEIGMPAGRHQFLKSDLMEVIHREASGTPSRRRSTGPLRHPRTTRWSAFTSPALVAVAIIAVVVAASIAGNIGVAPGQPDGSSSRTVEPASSGGPLTPDRADELDPGFTFCSAEGAICSFTGKRVVAFGAGAYTTRFATSPLQCVADQFGADPAPGLVKGCYLAPAGGPAGFTLCAAQGTTCAFNGYGRTIAYGNNGEFVQRVVSGPIPCTHEAFGVPTSTPGAACYIAQPGPPPGGWHPCSVEGEHCAALEGQPVAYGAYGAFQYRAAPGTLLCTNATFGGDPVAGESKACYTRSGPPDGFASTCAIEGAQCAFTGRRTVAFGSRGAFVYRSFTDGVACTAEAVGDDPLPGAPKSCHLTPGRP
jgi:hypothetical protein